LTVDNFRVLFGYNICVLTQRQKQIYDFLGAFNAKQGFSPTIKEIQRHFRLSSSATVHEHLNKLEKKGYLDKKRGLARAIQPKNPGQTLVNIPLLGTIAAVVMFYLYLVKFKLSQDPLFLSFVFL